MLRKNKPVIPLLFLFIVIAFIGVSLLLPKIKLYQAKLEQENKQGQVKELSLKLLGDSSGEVKAKEIRKQICSLTARPESEREKAVLAVKKFLGNTSEEVFYQCNDSFYDQEKDVLIAAKSETYTVGLNTFIVNPLTNHIIQADIKDYPESSLNYGQREIEDLGKKFIQEHAGVLGEFDLSKLNFEAGKKVIDAKDINYFLTWTGESKRVSLNPPAVTCSLDLNKDTPGIYYDTKGTPCIKNYETTITPSLQIAINRRGQILNYSNSFEGVIGRNTSF